MMVKFFAPVSSPQTNLAVIINNNNNTKTEATMFPFKMASINSLLAPAASSAYPATSKGSTAAPLKSAFSIQSILAETKKEKRSEVELKHNNNNLRGEVKVEAS